MIISNQNKLNYKVFQYQSSIMVIYKPKQPLKDAVNLRVRIEHKDMHLAKQAFASDDNKCVFLVKI